MKFTVALLTALILTLGLTAFAQSEASSPSRAHSWAPAQTIEELANAAAKAWGEGNLSSLDAGRPYLGSVKVIVEVQAGEPAKVWRKTFTKLAQIDKWFKSRERADGPGRNVGELEQCSKGICTFKQEGMLHNNLYLKQITYGTRRGKPYIKAIYVDDGA